MTVVGWTVRRQSYRLVSHIAPLIPILVTFSTICVRFKTLGGTKANFPFTLSYSCLSVCLLFVTKTVSSWRAWLFGNPRSGDIEVIEVLHSLPVKMYPFSEYPMQSYEKHVKVAFQRDTVWKGNYMYHPFKWIDSTWICCVSKRPQTSSSHDCTWAFTQTFGVCPSSLARASHNLASSLERGQAVT